MKFFPRIPKIQISRSNRPRSSQTLFPVNIKLKTGVLQLERVDAGALQCIDLGEDDLYHWTYWQVERRTSVSYHVRKCCLYLHEGVMSNYLLELGDVFYAAWESDREVLSIDVDLTDVSFGKDWARCYEPSP